MVTRGDLPRPFLFGLCLLSSSGFSGSEETWALRERPQALRQVGGEPWTRAPVLVPFPLMEDEKEGTTWTERAPARQLRPRERNGRGPPSAGLACVHEGGRQPGARPCPELTLFSRARGRNGPAHGVDLSRPGTPGTRAGRAGPVGGSGFPGPPPALPFLAPTGKVGRGGPCTLQGSSCSAASGREPSGEGAGTATCSTRPPGPLDVPAVWLRACQNQDRDGLLSVWSTFFHSLSGSKIHIKFMT